MTRWLRCPLETALSNGFVVADAREAFVVETVDREWLSERVDDIRVLSNEYSIDESLAWQALMGAPMVLATEKVAGYRANL